MEPHMGSAGLALSRSSAVSAASGADRGSLRASWLLFSLVGKHKEGLSAVSPAAPGRFWPVPNVSEDLGNGSLGNTAGPHAQQRPV